MSTNEEMDLMKRMKALAEKNDASKNHEEVRNEDKKAKWALHIGSRSTLQLLNDAIANEKAAQKESARTNLRAVMMQLVQKEMPIQEDDGTVMNMRDTIMTELDEVDVQPEELYPARQLNVASGVETTGGCAYSNPDKSKCAAL